MNQLIRMLRQFGTAAVMSLSAAAASAATLSGTVTFPTSDGGDAPRTVTTRIRVMGTQLTAIVIEDSINRSLGTFTLPNVPNGPITLILEEPLGNNVPGDRFTQDSKRLQLYVTGDVSGLAFAPAFHWQNLPSYPPPYHNPSYDIWQPYFVSDQTGFMSFLNRGVSPFVHELWRTTDGGTSWSKIGEWVYGTSLAIPDFVSGLDMLFVDADHGVMTARFGPPNYTPLGVLRTADGGVTWENIDFPNVPPEGSEPGGNGRVGIGGYAAISSTHWIACGSENIGTYMGSGVAGYMTFWETTDAGATWQIAHSRRQDGGACSAMGAYPDGRAFIFDTPYAFGGLRILATRDTSGAWALQADNNLVTNTGYGPADAPVLDGTAWLSGARWEGYSTVEQGTYQSLDGGVTWSKIGDALLQSIDFSTSLKGFATAGGPAYASYDGGKTWRFQGQGGGICCHGNYIYAFGAAQAIWKDGGVGDPDGLSDVFRYTESAAPNLEVLAAAGVSDSTVNYGATLVPVLAFQLTSRGLEGVTLEPLRVRASGTGNDQTEITTVGLWLDRNANGVVDADDSGITSAAYPRDNGEVVLDPAGAVVLHQLNPQQLLMTYDLAVAIRDGVTFTAMVASSQVEAVTIDDAALTVQATAPTGTVITGATVTSEVPPATSVTLVAAPQSPQMAGTLVRFTAQADGGTGSYQYKYLLRMPGGTLNTVREHSSVATWDWDTSGLVAGTYQVVVHARNLGSTKSYETYQSISYGLITPASAVTLTPNVTSPATVGSTVTFTAAASGGIGSYEYKFLLRPPGGILSIVRDYAASASWNWSTTGLVAGTYQVVVHARNVGSTKSYETYQPISYQLATPASAVTLRPSVASPATVGASVTFTAAASGGSGTYEYKYLLRLPGGTLNTVRDYSTSASWNWNTTGLLAGTYQVVVHARNVGSTRSYETYQSMSYGLITPASAVTLTANVPSPAIVGTTVIFTAAASGGSGSYEYKYLLRLPGGTLNTVRDYSTSANWHWNTTGLLAGTYQVVVHARNVGSTRSYETYQAISYGLAPP